ncbi:MAG: hypothetical protein HQM15_02865 [Deltaproteobacteria bacterium]|nr:hypothetical protein [Deltaproteobacteria bacterium]
MRALLQTNFKEVAEVKADSKNRISLGRKIQSIAKHYRLYQESSTGKILLEPLHVIPVSEPWLKKNLKAKKSVERGITQAKAGRLIKITEDFTKYIEDPE